MTRKPLCVTERAVSELVPYPRNARRHSKRQIAQIARSIGSFGFLNPVLIDANDTVMAGHGRVEAAQLLGLDTVPTIRVDHLNEAERRAYILADNRIGENAGWDRDILRLELQLLDDSEIVFDLSVTGFDMGEIDFLLDPDPPAPEDAAGTVAVLAVGAPVSRNGDLWELGPHRILCGNALDDTAYQRLLGGQQAEVVFIDPPYNVPINGHVRSRGRGSHREFPMASGEMTSEAFAGFLGSVFDQLSDHSIDGSIHFVCMDWRHLGETLVAGHRIYTDLKNICVWAKDRAGMGSLYRSRHELVLVFKSGSAAHINNVELGKHGRDRSNVWSYPAVRPSRLDREAGDPDHPTIKPVGLVADALRDCSRRKGIVLDVFGGSGTTLIAAHKTGRRARLIELDPLYVDATLRRWEALTGETAVHADNGESFAALERERGIETKANDMTATTASATAKGKEVDHD